jgi:hypothetical protein
MAEEEVMQATFHAAEDCRWNGTAVGRQSKERFSE